MSYAIDSFTFVRWFGQPPQLVTNHVRIQTKLGQNGISAQATGIHGDPFDFEAETALADQSQVAALENAYRSLVGSSPVVVIHNGNNYFTTYGHKYLVLDVKITQTKRHPRLIGPGYDYIGGWLLRSRWQLLPIA